MPQYQNCGGCGIKRNLETVHNPCPVCMDRGKIRGFTVSEAEKQGGVSGGGGHSTPRPKLKPVNKPMPRERRSYSQRWRAEEEVLEPIKDAEDVVHGKEIMKTEWVQRWNFETMQYDVMKVEKANKTLY